MYSIEDRYDKYIKVYKGALFEQSSKIEEVYVNSEKSEKNGKVIVFDLDETIGSFADLYILWEVIEKYIHIKPNTKIDFNELLDLYPEFLRHGIINILEFLYHKKQTNQCSGIFIYTNNQCKIGNGTSIQDSWVSKIVNYLTLKIVPKNEGSPKHSSPNIVLFDQIIHAFKINNKIVEVKRTTNDKTHKDFIQCTLLPKTTEICFIDNSFFPSMKKDRIYYIQPRSYTHYLSTDDIIDRFMSSTLSKDPGIETHLYDHFLLNRRIHSKTAICENQIEIDIKISQKMMYYIREFFYLSLRKMKTRKIKLKVCKYSRKKNHNPNSV